MIYMKPIIGVSLRITNADGYDEKRDSLSHDMSMLLEQLGFHPLLIPNTISDISVFLDTMKVSGIILSGGDNMGDEPIRDKTEKKLIDFAISKSIPLIGICRGMQVINSYFKGKIKHLENLSHVNKSHKINLLNNIFIKNNSIQVNSFHQNVIELNHLGENLTPFAISEFDNTIEGFIHKKYSIVGVMWHPEREKNFFNLEIFKKIFVDGSLT